MELILSKESEVSGRVCFKKIMIQITYLFRKHNLQC